LKYKLLQQQNRRRTSKNRRQETPAAAKASSKRQATNIMHQANFDGFFTNDPVEEHLKA